MTSILDAKFYYEWLPPRGPALGSIKVGSARGSDGWRAYPVG